MIRPIIRLYRAAFAGLGRDVWLVCAGLLVNRAGTMVLPFLSLYLTNDRGLSVATAGGLLSLYGLGAIGGAYLGGWLSDRIGAIPAQLLSLTLGGFLYCGMVWLESVPAIAVALLVVSVVAEAFRPAAMAAIGERAPRELQARAFALLRLAANVGMAIGPAVGGWLAMRSYASLFYVEAVTGWLAAVFLAVAVGTGASESRAVSPGTGASSDSPWRDGPFLLLLLLVTAVATALFQVFSTVPLYFRDAYGQHENLIGMLLGFNALLIIAFEMVLIHWVERYDALFVVGLGAFLLCGGLGLMPLGSTMSFAALTITVWTVGEMLCLPMLNVLVARRASSHNRGRYMGLYTMAFASAFVLGPLVGTYVYEELGPDLLWYGIGALGVLLGLFASALRRPLAESRS